MSYKGTGVVQKAPPLVCVHCGQEMVAGRSLPAWSAAVETSPLELAAEESGTTVSGLLDDTLKSWPTPLGQRLVQEIIFLRRRCARKEETGDGGGHDEATS